MSPPKHSIPIVIIGVHRAHALEVSGVLDSTPYYVAAVLDFTESPSQYQYSAQNLGATLNALNPRVQALVTGTAVVKIVPEVRKIWEEYLKNTLSKEGRRGLYVPMTDFHSADGPPPPGTMEYLLEKLDAAFR